MKKYVIILLLLSIALVGCDTDSGQKMSFKQASSIFSHTVQNVQKQETVLWLDGFKYIDLDINLLWENRDFKLESHSSLSWSLNFLDHNHELYTNLDWVFWDKIEQSQYHISGWLSNLIIKDKIYSLLKSYQINLWTGNYQANLLSLLLDSIQNKRIETPTWYDYNLLKQTKQDIKYISDKLSLWRSFQTTQTLNYEWNLAYRIEFIPNILYDINSNTNIQIKNFQWLLIVRSASKVELKIEKLEIFGKQNIIVKWAILPQTWILKFQSQDDLDKVIQISWEQNRHKINITIDKLVNTQKLLWLNIQLQPKLSAKTLKQKIDIDGVFTISPLIVYGSNLEKDIKIDITGQYKFEDIENIQIKKPDSYILWEQLIWDQFSLKTILSK